MYAVLKNKEVIQIESVEEWAHMFENIDDRRLAHTQVGEDVFVSTVFLGMDHGFGRKPQWFESMVFGGEHDQGICVRYETWSEAQKGHLEIVEDLGGPFKAEPITFLSDLKRL